MYSNSENICRGPGSGCGSTDCLVASRKKIGQNMQPNSVLGKNKISTLQHKNQMERGNIVDGAAMPFMTHCVILKSTHINCYY